MDYDALVKRFGKDQADLIVSQMNSDPRLQRFTPQRLNQMSDDAIGVSGTIKAPEMTIPRFIELGGRRGLERLGMEPDRANQYAGMLQSVSEFFTPIGDAIGFENASNLFDDAQRQVEGENYFRAAADYSLGAIEGALAVIGTAGGPIGKGISRGGRRLLRSNLRNRPNTPPSVKTSGLEGVAGKVNINYNKMTKPQLDPLGYQKTKMSIPMSEVIPQQESMNNLLDRIAIGIEDMQGKRVMPMYWDRSVGDVKLTGIKSPLGIYDQFDQPVFPDAGVDFMRGQAHQADGSLIASKDSIVSTLTNRAKLEAKRTGDEVYPMTVSMANDGADFTAFESEVMAEMMKFAPVTKKAAKTFDKEMQILDPNWIGVQHPKLRDYIKKSSPDIRKAFIKKIDTAPHQAENFPPSAMARYSVTAPDQRTLPAGMAGLGIGKLDGGIVKNPTFEHSTYKTQGTGDYTGSMTPVPQGLIWKDEYARMANLKTKAGKPYSEANKTYALKTILPTQKIDQEIVDNVMEWIARNRQ